MLGHDPVLPRVCDVALLCIEQLSLCGFQETSLTIRSFHDLPEQDRSALIAHIRAWRQANSGRPIYVGMRAQLRHASLNNKIWTADRMMGVARICSPEHAEWARDILRLIAKGVPDSTAGIAAAEALRVVDGQRQEFSPADVAAEVLQKRLSKDWGYRASASPAARLEAIRSARTWWWSEGRGEYSFEKIRQRIDQKGGRGN